MRRLFERLVNIDDEAVKIVVDAKGKADKMLEKAKIKNKDGLETLKSNTLEKERKKEEEFENKLKSLKGSFDKDFEKEFTTLKKTTEKNWDSAIKIGVELILQRDK